MEERLLLGSQTQLGALSKSRENFFSFPAEKLLNYNTCAVDSFTFFPASSSSSFY